MLRVVNSLLVAVFLVVVCTLPLKGYATDISPATLILTEVKIRYDSASALDPDEFVEIFNASLVPIALSNYVIEYFNTTNPTEAQQPIQKVISDQLLAPGGQLVLAKQPTKVQRSVLSPFSSLSDTGGRLRIVTTDGDIVDEVAWTNSQALATSIGTYPSIVYQCNASNALCTANRAQSFSRQLNAEGLYLIDNATWSLAAVSPASSELLPPITETEEEQPNLPPDNPEPPATESTDPSCEGIIISELLPNAEGSDTNKEFIELYNPTNEPVSLLGCSLQVSSSTKTYELGDVSVLPGAYIALSDQLTGLSLPNAAGATVWLLTSQNELQAVTYPGDIDEDVSWALLRSVWQQTYVPTPGLGNLEQPFEPCEVGEQRNSVTNDCQKVIVTAVAELTPCKAGQERSPSTNRCRSVITAAALVACKVDQERSPETNRCRAVNGTSTLSACTEGEERNAETNRCRKVANANETTLAKVTDIKSPSVGSGSKVWIIVAAILLAVGYAIYEWRQDIAQLTGSLIVRLKRH